MIDIGSHVVCIRDEWPAVTNAENYWKKHFHRPIKGTVYTVRTINKTNGKVWIRLEELVNPVVAKNKKEPYYNITSFKPLKKIKVEDFIMIEEWAK